jgi:hypothetical protein
MSRKQSDFEAFERVMVEAHQRQPIRILSCELDGSCQRALDREGARPRASQHRERTTLRRGRMGAANSLGADRKGWPPRLAELGSDEHLCNQQASSFQPVEHLAIRLAPLTGLVP